MGFLFESQRVVYIPSKTHHLIKLVRDTVNVRSKQAPVQAYVLASCYMTVSTSSGDSGSAWNVCWTHAKMPRLAAGWSRFPGGSLTSGS